MNRSFAEKSNNRKENESWKGCTVCANLADVTKAVCLQDVNV